MKQNVPKNCTLRDNDKPNEFDKNGSFVAFFRFCFAFFGIASMLTFFFLFKNVFFGQTKLYFHLLYNYNVFHSHFGFSYAKTLLRLSRTLSFSPFLAS